jgi:hypothetical protein
MGASGWHYFVPYDADLSGALKKLREDVFARGDYYKPLFRRRPTSLAQLEETAGEDGTHSVIDVRRVLDEPLPEPMLQWLQREMQATGKPPPDDERNRRMRAEIAVSGSVGRLSDTALQRVFGTTRPDHATAERSVFGAFELIPRGCGAVVVVYEGDRVAELLFVGKSGD